MLKEVHKLVFKAGNQIEFMRQMQNQLKASPSLHQGIFAVQE